MPNIFSVTALIRDLNFKHLTAIIDYLKKYLVVKSTLYYFYTVCCNCGVPTCSVMSTWVICTFWTVELRKCRISTDHTRTTHLLCIMRHAEQVTIGFLIARSDSALWARGIQGTHVTRTRGESVARTLLEVPHVLNMLWRVCVLQTPYGVGTDHAPILKFVPRFCKYTARTCKYSGLGSRLMPQPVLLSSL